MHRDLASLLDRIRLLLEQDAADPSVPILTELENTLTDGYAVALELVDLHLYLRRVTVNRATYGTPEDHNERIATMVLGAA